MNVFYALEKHQPKDRKHAILTVGNFDGLHLGHQALIRKIVEEARNHALHPTVITFINHPAQIIHPDQCPLKITTNEHRIELFHSLGVEDLYMLEFSKELASQTTPQFLEHLSETLHINKICMGHDAAIGKDREGNFTHLKKWGETLKFEVSEFPPVLLDGEILSSTLVRKALLAGDLSAAKKLLGRPYSIYGKVVTGEGQGSKIGFPTANIQVAELSLPPQGVYSVDVFIYGHQYKGIANLGIAPTVKNFSPVTLEVHIIHSHPTLYNVPIEVVFNNFIRPEKKFDSIEELKNQIQRDIDLITL